jgi:hypothetical protein
MKIDLSKDTLFKHWKALKSEVLSRVITFSGIISASISLENHVKRAIKKYF